MLRHVPLGILLLFFDAGGTAQTSPNESLEITRGPRGHGRIALTFDAGGEADYFNDLMKALSICRVAAFNW